MEEAHTLSISPFAPSAHGDRLLIPMESRLENSPDHPQGDQGTSSTDSSESKSQCSEYPPPLREEQPREHVPPLFKILDSGLNFRLGHGGTQVMARFQAVTPSSDRRLSDHPQEAASEAGGRRQVGSL